MPRRKRTAHNPVRIPCPHCEFEARNLSGWSQHVNARHRQQSSPPPDQSPNQSPNPPSNPPLNPRYSPPNSPAFSDGDLPSVSHYDYENDGSESDIDRVDPDDYGDDGAAWHSLHHGDIHESEGLHREFHDKLIGSPCDNNSNILPSGTPLPPYTSQQHNDWFPFESRLQFEMAFFIFRRQKMSQPSINWLMDAWASDVLKYGGSPPFANYTDMHTFIDDIQHGDAPWHCLTVSYNGPLPDGLIPSWMEKTFEVWYRDPLVVVKNMLANPDFKNSFDTTPYREWNAEGKRRFGDFFSGNWVWRQADIIAEDERTHGSMFVPILLGSDKTTVSVATGNNEYYPLYISIGNVHNHVRRAHRNALTVLAFLAIPKSEKKYDNNAQFRRFRRQLFHSSLAAVLQPLRPGMKIPEVVRCPDGHFRRAIFGIGPYIADYPEQVLVVCVVQGWCPKGLKSRDELESDAPCIPRSREHTEELLVGWDLNTLWDDYGTIGDVIPFTAAFPRADLYELISGDILHQVIKGTFKDHLVTWVGDYLVQEHGEQQAKVILDEIDKRIAAVPSFPGLRRFPQGRNFKQWTGDDSKALMKVYLPSLVGLVPDDMVRSFRAFLEFCYIVRHSVLSEDDLTEAEEAIIRFRRYREIFRTTGVRDNFNLPRQHAVTDHFIDNIREFGAPNGVCTSITESKHIEAVKEPWRHSSRYEALGQMLLTNQRNDKLAAALVDFEERGMLQGTLLSEALAELESAEDLDEDELEFRATIRQLRETRIASSIIPNVVNDREEEDDDNDPALGGFDGAVFGKGRVDARVSLARKPARGYPKDSRELGLQIGVPDLPQLISTFLHEQLENNISPESHPSLLTPTSSISVFHSAVAEFYSPSNVSGLGGSYHERIRAVPSWRSGPGRYDCAFLDKDPLLKGMEGLHAVRVRLFFSFKFNNHQYPCALIQWFSPVSDEPDELTGMWIVEPDLDENGRRVCAVVHINTMMRGAHLIGVYGSAFLPDRFSHTNSLDAFRAFYVNKFADHNANEIAF